MAHKPKKKQLPAVKVGQIWVDTDSRNEGKRELVVVSRVKKTDKKDPSWVCKVFQSGEDTGRTTKVRQSRFKPGSTGYRLKEPIAPDTQAEDPFKDVDAQPSVPTEAQKVAIPVPWAKAPYSDDSDE